MTKTAKTNIANLKLVLSPGTHGRKFTSEEESLIIKMVTDAKNAGTTVSVADIRTAVAKFNVETQKEEGRTRAAVVQAIERLAKAKKIDDSVIATGENGRTKYTDEENEMIAKLANDAALAGKTLNVGDIHKALVASKVSPKDRTLPSVRAHLANLVKQTEEDAAKAQA